jgi:hypothetical protein
MVKKERRCAVDIIKRIFSAVAAMLHVLVSPDDYPELVGYHRDEHEGCWQ